MNSSLSALLANKAPTLPKEVAEQRLETLQVKIQQLQQAAWMNGQRIVIVFEGFDAAGKGSSIRRLTAKLDPRGCRVIPIAAPVGQEKTQHYLQRFWKELPSKGQMVVFDRSWYGRVLVELVEKLTPVARCQAAFREIQQFEKMLTDDGIILIKIFLAVSYREQGLRFKERLNDPLKSWKITQEDIRNRAQWANYVKATDHMLKKCRGWVLIPADDKPYARVAVLRAIAHGLSGKVKLTRDDQTRIRSLKRQLRALEGK